MGYLNVIVAQTSALNDRITALNIRGRQVAAAVQLFAALGGDWQGTNSASPATGTAASARP